jgi:putative PIN family toxin of toxin-antitoxin system
VLVVLDTNVVIAGLLNAHGTPAYILRLVLENKLRLCYNSAILIEYEEVAGRAKFAPKIDQRQVSRLFDIFRKIGVSFTPVPGTIPLIDETDRIFYDTAKESGAILITGNKKHFPKAAFITSPADFITAFDAEAK